MTSKKALITITDGHFFFADPGCALAKKMSITGAMNEFNCTLNAVKSQLSAMIIGRTALVIIEYTDDNHLGIEPVAVMEVHEKILADATSAMWTIAIMEEEKCEQS